MKKLRCTSCGAELKVDEKKEYATCEHCGSKYKLNEDLNINIKIDDSVKDVINSGLGTAKHFSWIFLIPVALIMIMIICSMVFSFSSRKEFNKKTNEIVEEGKSKAESVIDEAAKHSFNSNFYGASGSKYGINVGYTIDDIIESNKTNDRKVSLTYDGQSTTDETEMINIKHSLGQWDKYEVVVNYDDDGFINEIKVDIIG